MFLFILSSIAKILGLVVPLLVAVAYLTLAERKVMASMQRRKGPNVVGFFGILQPLADGLKLLIKEPVLPSSANTIVFLAAPVVTFLLALISWAVIPFWRGNGFIRFRYWNVIHFCYFITWCLWCYYGWLVK